ncbi:hypothetical protein B0T22DRAFT_484985 [Podospora appendiculata]|uniref:Uncharacterized protein n=1 Tax=Podospora appendiculata TaxID=314037 RepID=A0AAE0X1X6_9PEZI|nr:hypothetical protein B0T22DRAFT_484985 [Podospora appendiculata]
MDRPSPTSRWSRFVACWTFLLSTMWTWEFVVFVTFRAVMQLVAMWAAKTLFESMWAGILAAGLIAGVAAMCFDRFVVDRTLGEDFHSRRRRATVLRPEADMNVKLALDVSEHGQALTKEAREMQTSG